MKDYYPELKENIFAGAPKFSTEPAMYQWITDTINGSDVINSRNVVCASTPYKSDRNDATHQAVDLGLYSPQFRPINEGDGEYNRRINWSRIELSIECKADPTDQDPFDDTTDDLQPLAADRKKALGQILTYVENVFKHQHRTFHYMILFLGHYARIVHFDHSGVFSTVKFNYKTHGAILTTFLSRFSHYNASNRGHDPTATRLDRRGSLVAKMRKLGEAKAAAHPDDHVQQMFNASLENAWPWYKLEVHVQPKSGEPEPPRGRLRSSRPTRVTRSFVVGKPHFDAGGVVGRGTRGYVAVEVDSTGELVGPFVYLKDAWRVDHPGIEQEGCVLETLNHNEVPFVPTLICHGDLEGQVTRSQDAWAKREVKKRGSKRTFKKHQHYRLVVAEVGKPLEHFATGARLVIAIYCCILAHQAAYERAGIIHRDISSGNILLYKENGVWVGLLNDWELSKRVNAPAVRQPDRTGTWQFMSAKALNNPDKEITVEDELEAFFHVLLYHAVRFLPHNIEHDSVPKFLEDYFDGCSTKGEEYRCGMAKLSAMENGSINLSTYNTTPATLKFLHPEDQNKTHVLDSIISRLLLSFKAAYARDPDTREQGVTQAADITSDFLTALGAKSNVPKPTVAAPVTPQKPVKSKGKGKSRASPKPSRRRGRKAAAVASTTNAAATSSSAAEGAISLKEHGPLVDFFYQYIRRTDWPLNDKCEDLRAKAVKAAATGHQEAAFNPGRSESTSRKRALENAQPAPGASKRSKV
ncbi:hypothetical protein K466DRAFT_488926 [Polyporus arcularius HHB13444]|uniref:Protein kinase domain-containing protein n=1 Tax=Polyporus arcularius HHB13444 TaxID=1314778 RepID=A0A5C3PHS5_9APHY|nr:hypothetical protein K466DRAFT_488926 [Polyporus arcularius HHB13444]